VKRSIQAAVLAFALAPVGAHAQGATTPNDLTLNDALALARRANRTLTAEKARLAAAQTAVEQAWSALFPVVTVQGKYTHNYKEATLNFGALFEPFQLKPGAMAPPAPNAVILRQEQLDGQVNVTLPLIVPAAYPALDAVKKGVRSSEANYESAEATVLTNVAQAFYLAAAGDEVVVSRQSNIRVSRATLDNAKTRFAAGTVTKVDVDRAELAVVRAEQAERDAEYGRQQAYRALATLIQANAPFKVRAADVPSSPPTQALDTALQLRPEFRSLILTEESSTAQSRAYGWKWSPQLSAFGLAHIGNYAGFTGDKYNWAVGLQLDWTVFDGGTRDALRHQAAAQAAEAAARAQVLSDSIRDDLENGRRFLETKQAALQASTRAVVLAQETLDLVRSQYEAGTVTQVDLLQAQDFLVGAQEALAQSRFDVAVADVNLRRTAGTFPGK
jgi:outer membrane protein TolC